MTQRKQHDREFKLKAVELSYQKESIRELAHDLGVRPELIYRWRSEFATLKGKSFPGNGIPKQTEEDSELALAGASLWLVSLKIPFWQAGNELISPA